MATGTRLPEQNKLEVANPKKIVAVEEPVVAECGILLPKDSAELHMLVEAEMGSPVAPAALA